MIREIQHDIFLEYHIGHAICLQQQRVTQWLFSLALFSEYIREFHEVPEVMNTSTRQDNVFPTKIQPADQVCEQSLVHFLIIYKSNRFAFAPVLYSLFNFLNQRSGDVIIQVNLRILRD